MKFLLLLTGIFSLGFFAPAYSQKPRIDKEPAWIAHNNIDYASIGTPTDFEDGYVNLVLERQVNIGLQTTYVKRSYKIITEAGVQNTSEVSVDYDPAFQQASFHFISIIRDGKVLNRLDMSKIKVIHQEKELDRSIYNGEYSAILFLEDVRKGDIVEYAYSVKGFNPVFNGKFFTSLQTQYGVTIKNVFYKIVCPAGRKLNIKNRLTDLQPVITNAGTDKVYEWKIANPAVVRMQDRIPSWYDPFGEIMISEYDNWQQVVQWALPLFRNKAPLSKELKSKIEEIRQKDSSKEKQILAALRFVQDDVRYLGIEMGSNSHQPNAPNTIFARRFGDCKDKSFLLCTMLQALGIEALPVLINTEYKKGLKECLSSPGMFNHATVRVNFNNRYYWFDPTISFQRGGIGNIAYPDYQVGLVLSDSATGLANIPLQDSGKVVAKEVFTMENIDGPAQLTVTTTYTGSFADDTRSDVNSSSRSELQKNYSDFYNGYYDGVVAKDSMSIEDDEVSGQLIIREFYTVKHLWNVEKGQNKASFYGGIISSILRKPSDKERTMPLALTYPAHYIEEIEVHLPENWTFEESPVEIKTDAYSFSTSIFTTIRKLQLTFEYKALKDHVNTADADRFFKDYDKMKESIGYELTKGSDVVPDKKGSVADLVGTIVAAIVILGIVVMIVIVVLRR
ncbi:MAG: DUF3857 domain-containing transglutaminase family protein [Chitinophagaceae bacterium]